jgi:hypothetical protein
MPAHRIRLRGPWQLEEVAGMAPENAIVDRPQRGGPRQVRLPTAWASLLRERTGRVRFTRRFHLPTNLQPGDEVALILDRWPASSGVVLNGRTVSEVRELLHSQRAVMTSLLMPVNVLAIEFDAACLTAAEWNDGGPAGDVTLEIVSD